MSCTHRQRLITGICTILVWGILIGVSVKQNALASSQWIPIVELFVLLLVTYQFNIELPNKQHFTFETVFLVGFALIYPIHIVVIAGFFAVFALALSPTRNWVVTMVNMTGLVLCTYCGRLVYNMLAGMNTGFTIRNVIPFGLFGLSYILVNLLLIMVYFSIFYRHTTFSRLRALCSRQLGIVYVTSVLMGVLFACVMSSSGYLGSVIFAALVILTAYSYQKYFTLMNRFRHLKKLDELTGLYNYRYIQNVIDMYIDFRKPFTILLIDVDDFKSYNEKLGHVKGDEALRKLAAILRNQYNSYGKIARCAGEEFAILLDGVDLNKAKETAGSICRTVANEFAETGDLTKNLTVSIGIAQYPEMAQDKSSLFKMLDEALYKSKMTGWNKVSIFTTVLNEVKRQIPTDCLDEEVYKTIKAFLAILNSKDRYTYAHTERDVIYAQALAKRIGLDETQIRLLRFGAFLHDIGKIEIPYEILTKKGSLTANEWEMMKSHAEIGERIAKPIPELGPCLPIIRHHHERFDGTGYPDGIQGEEIPIEARILTLADSFDAMTTSRPYQKKRTFDAAITELRRCAGTQFDPVLVEPFVEAVKEIGLLPQHAVG